MISLGDMFGLDSGAQIGLEYRFGIIKNGQIGLHRTSDKTIQFFGQYGLLRQEQAAGGHLGFSPSTAPTTSSKDSYSPSVGAIVSRRFGTVAALYVEPIWVNNTNSRAARSSSTTTTRS